ncbi:N-formylglutamate amidohydrolase [Noviherbaspirillum saxi]|uniref:N-formylglutamate amidohydrolase n=1 Tax=Noviherbaspirillum saxi TaxID=2320863 RepID=A0A3A3FUY9_9BURK|nr:N-formylglutamate amidohydrolase [Noviherbaspirillum saxi]RJF98001.1 N-formylglutamate amidohydrolase [Noviherbaspirillum saxi]
MNKIVKPFELYLPAGEAIPLVCDSPHSGVYYPDDFQAAIPQARLREGEDTHVDALWRAAPEFGATLLAANFPRVYIDANRTLDDLDESLLETPWPEPLQPGPKTHLGFGLIWRNIDKNTPIYGRKLTVDEVRARIDQYYRPYHASLSAAIDTAYQRFGAVWHLNLHSMPNNAYERLGMNSPHPLADFVLGDRDGTTCDAEFVQLVASELRSLGYSVAINDPYKGVELIARIGDPSKRRNSLQIEARRPIYMDEKTREPNERFADVQRDMTHVLQKLADYICKQCHASLHK